MDGVIFLKKPIQILSMLDTILHIRKLLNEQDKSKEQQHKMQQLKELTSAQTDQDSPPNRVITYQEGAVKTIEPELKKNVNYEERKKTSKHKTAMLLDEQSFSSYIGILSGINFNDQSQLVNASYNAREYFQGYVQSAYNTSRDKGRVLNLNTAWKSVTILPHSREIWIDANDTQLRSFSAVPVSTFAGDQVTNITITPVDAKKT